MQKILKKMNLKFEKVIDKKYAKEIYKINNDKISRKNSLSSRKFKYSTHLVWLDKVIKDKSESIYLAFNKKKIIGLIREKKIFNKLYLSWALEKSSRGKKIGEKLLKKFTKINKKKYYAQILDKNISSIKICKKSGFKKFKKKKNIFFFTNKI